jgi:large subunit ribosomal protein L17
VLELVDGPRDLKFEMTARATGWDVLSGRLKDQSARALVKHGVGEVGDTVVRERALGEGQEGGELRQRTRWNLQKALRYRSEEDIKRFGDKVHEHMVRILESIPRIVPH